MLNACVRKLGESEYSIEIYSGCLNLYHQIEEITSRYNEDDLQSFFRFKHLGIFELYPEDTYREELNNLFATLILLHIFWHEVGHISAGYVDRKCEYIEFDSSKLGNYSKQEQEMVADWLATKQLFLAIYFTAIHETVKDNEELIIALKQLITLYWITLTIEFQIFDLVNRGKVSDWSKLTHPHPSVRLLYNLEAMAEAIVDIFNSLGFEDETSDKFMLVILQELYIWIQSYMGITDCPIDVEKNRKEAYECYMILRRLPYSKEYKRNNLFHLDELDDKTEEEIKNYIRSLH